MILRMCVSGSGTIKFWSRDVPHLLLLGFKQCNRLAGCCGPFPLGLRAAFMEDPYMLRLVFALHVLFVNHNYAKQIFSSEAYKYKARVVSA